MNLDPLKKLLDSSDGIFKEKEPMAPFTSLKIGGRALFYAKPSRWESLPQIIRFLHDEKLPFKVLGRGTNLLISDKDLDFGVLHILRMDGAVKIDDFSAEVDSDVLLTEFCKETFENSLTGLEPVSMIPGSVGGAVFMNAGAYGKSIFNFIKDVSLLSPDGSEITLTPSELKVGYRETNIKNFGIVKKVRTALKKGFKRDIEIRVKEFSRKRNETQPWKSRTAGSIFRNPEGDSAGRILEELGFKGQKNGDAAFSELHSNFLINSDKAAFSDAFSLIENARQKALSKGYRLEYEMEVWNCD
jgi:UDP-N-acetylmuramate dehydrogenase